MTIARRVSANQATTAFEPKRVVWRPGTERPCDESLPIAPTQLRAFTVNRIVQEVKQLKCKFGKKFTLNHVAAAHFALVGVKFRYFPHFLRGSGGCLCRWGFTRRAIVGLQAALPLCGKPHRSKLEGPRRLGQG